MTKKNSVSTLSAAIAFALLPGMLCGQQWNCSGSTCTTTATSVGIGTTAPTQALDVLDNRNPGGSCVGIGTATPCATGAPAGCSLSVNGAIQAKEVAVSTGWSDYVFDAWHHLTPPAEVADFIRANHHLPEVPSAKEVEDKGVGLCEMQSTLLAKIEEGRDA